MIRRVSAGDGDFANAPSWDKFWFVAGNQA